MPIRLPEGWIDVTEQYAPDFQVRLPEGWADVTEEQYAQEFQSSLPEGWTDVTEEYAPSSLEAFAETVTRIPENLAAQAIAAFQGQTGASVTDRGYLDRFYNWVDKRNRELAEKYKDTGDFIPGVISKEDVAQLGPNLGFTGVSMAGTLLGGAAGAITPVPGAAVVGGLAGGGLAAYRMQSYQTMNEWLNRKNEESIQQFGQPISPEEEQDFRANFDALATESGLWEAGPEAVGNVLELALMAGKGTLPGRIASLIPKGVTGKFVKGLGRTAGIFGTEEATETVTRMGQQRAEVKAGMSDEPMREWTSGDDWLKSAKEVLPQVLMLTGVMTGAGKAYRSLSGEPESQAAPGQLATEQPDSLPGVPPGAAPDLLSSLTGKLSPEYFRDIQKAILDGHDQEGQPFSLDDANEILEAYQGQPGADAGSIRTFESILGTLKGRVAPVEETDVPDSVITEDDKNKAIIEEVASRPLTPPVAPVEEPAPMPEPPAPRPGDKSFIDNKIRELGTIEAVNSHNFGDPVANDYARTMAPKILGVTPMPTPAVETPVPPRPAPIVQPGATPGGKQPTDLATYKAGDQISGSYLGSKFSGTVKSDRLNQADRSKVELTVELDNPIKVYGEERKSININRDNFAFDLQQSPSVLKDYPELQRPAVSGYYPALEKKAAREALKKVARLPRSQNPMAAVAAEIKKKGRLQLGAKQTPTRAKYGFLADYSKQDSKALNKMYPTLLSSTGTQNLDEIAEGLGHNSGDELFQALMYPDRPAARKGEAPAEADIEREAREHAVQAQEAYDDERRRERAEFVRILAGRGESIPDIVQSAIAKIEAVEELTAEEKQALTEFADKWAKAESDTERLALENETGDIGFGEEYTPTKESYIGKKETQDLGKEVSAAKTFDLTAAPGEIFHGEISRKKMTETQGMFGKPETPKVSFADHILRAVESTPSGILSQYETYIAGVNPNQNYTVPKGKRIVLENMLFAEIQQNTGALGGTVTQTGSGNVGEGIFEVDRPYGKLIYNEAAGEISVVPSPTASNMAAETAKFGVDKTLLLQTLSKDIVNNDLPGTIANETIQNALDAFLPGQGAKNIEISIETGYVGGGMIRETVVTVSDNGRGMTAGEVKRNLLRLGAKGKSGTSTRGGYGLAKAGFLLAPRSAEITTVKDGVSTVLKGTREQFFGVKGAGDPMIETTDAPGALPGTRFELRFFDDQEQAEKENAYALNQYNAVYGFDKYLNDGVFVDGVTVDYKPGYSARRTIEFHHPSELPQVYPKQDVNIKGNHLSVYFVEDKVPLKKGWDDKFHPKLSTLNKGLALFGITADQYRIDGLHVQPAWKVIVDFNKTPDVRDINYPFIRNRTQMNEEISKAVAGIINKRVKSLNEADFDLQKSDFAEMVSKSPVINGIKILIPFKDQAEFDKAATLVSDNSTLVSDMAGIFKSFQAALDKIGGKNIELAMTVDPKVHGYRSDPSVVGHEFYAINPFAVTRALVLNSTYKQIVGSGYDSTTAMASNLVHVLVHEYTHNSSKGEGENFTGVLAQNYMQLTHGVLARLEQQARRFYEQHGERLTSIQDDLAGMGKGGSRFSTDNLDVYPARQQPRRIEGGRGIQGVGAGSDQGIEHYTFEKNYYTKNEDGSVTVPDFDAIPETKWKQISDRLIKSGYDIRGAGDAKRIYRERLSTDGVIPTAFQDHIEVLEKVLKVGPRQEPTADQKWHQKVLRQYGSTQNIREGGYILPSGTMVDLSGKKEGGPAGTRSLDHREVGGTEGMQEFMASGAIRMDGNSGAIDLVRPPTANQQKVIERIIREKRGELSLDLWNGLGEKRDRDSYNTYYLEPKRTFSKVYDKGTNPQRILSDIDDFYSGKRVERYALVERPSDFIIPTLSDVQSIFKGQEVVQPGGENAPVYIKTRGGKYLTIETVNEISPDEVDFEYSHGEKFDKKTMRISGAYGDGVVRLARGVAGKWTLNHESMHFLEDSGILNTSDIAILKGHIKGQVRDGKIETANKNDVGGAEDRANFLADALIAEKPLKGLVGRVVARVREFLDRLVEAFTGHRTVGGIVRSVESGRIFEQELPDKTVKGFNIDDHIHYAVQRILDNKEGYKKAEKSTEPPSDPVKAREWIKNEADLFIQEAVFQVTPDVHRMGFLKKFITSPEWYEHPVLSRIVRLFVRDRNEIYHELYGHLNNLEQPQMDENTIGEFARKLKHKGLNWKQKMSGKSSKEYQDLLKILEEADIDEVEYSEQNLKKQGYSDDTIKVWKAFRESYDKALDLMTSQMTEMMEKIEEEAAFKGIKPVDYSSMYQTLKGALASMGQLRGTYAPRIRQGNWAVTAYKGEGEDVEYYREHRFSHMAANRLANKLKVEGWSIRSVSEVQKLPEDIYQDLKAVSVAKAIEAAIDNMSKGKYGEAIQDQALRFNEEILREVADLIKARGFRSSMIRRTPGANVVKGYIEDPIERHSLYTNNVARGIAKAKVAGAAMNELLGTYIKGRRFGGISPKKESEIYTTAKDYIDEQLRNLDKTDVIIGWAKSLATLKFLGLSVRAAVVNMTAIATTTPSSIHQYVTEGRASFMKINRALGVAGKDAVKFMAGKKVGSEDDIKFLQQEKRLGWDDPQYTRDMIAKVGSTRNRAWAATMDGAMWMFGKTEQWNRLTTMLAAFRLARADGKDFAQASELAKTASDRAHGVYGRATLPSFAWGRSESAKIGQMLYVYSKFSHNYLQLLTDLGFKKHNWKAFSYALLAPMILSGVAAWPLKDQTIMPLLGILFSVLGIKDKDEDFEKWMWDQTRKRLGEGAEIAGRYGAMGALGLDISGSLSIGVGIPRDFWEWGGAIGGFGKEGYEAYKQVRKGNYGRAFESVLPSGIANPLRAYRESEEGLTTRKGFRVWDEMGRPYEPTTGETALRVAGFRSAKQAATSERLYEAKEQAQEFKDKRDRIYELYRAYLTTPESKRDYEKLKDVRNKIKEYKKTVRDLGLTQEVADISFSEMRNRINKQMRRANKKTTAMMK